MLYGLCYVYPSFGPLMGDSSRVLTVAAKPWGFLPWEIQSALHEFGPRFFPFSLSEL